MLNAKPDTDDQAYLTILYTSQGFQNIFRLDALNKNINRYRAYLTIHVLYTVQLQQFLLAVTI